VTETATTITTVRLESIEGAKNGLRRLSPGHPNGNGRARYRGDHKNKTPFRTTFPPKQRIRVSLALPQLTNPSNTLIARNKLDAVGCSSFANNLTRSRVRYVFSLYLIPYAEYAYALDITGYTKLSSNFQKRKRIETCVYSVLHCVNVDLSS